MIAFRGCPLRLPLSLSLLFLAFAPVFSQAPLQRLALVIGNNRGLLGEEPLRHAVRDARSLAATLQTSGSIEKDRIYLLENPSVEGVLAVLQEMQGRIKEMRRNGGQVLALAYYSGHGSPDALHLGGSRLGRREFLEAFKSVPAHLKILVLDACESGGFLRSKGGNIIATPRIEHRDELQLNGMAVLSSSSKSQKALESEKLKGSLFTHHFVNGLQGAADQNRDGLVTLWEVFSYAKAGTESDALETGGMVQNPGFDFDLVGSSDFEMSRVQKGNGGLLLRHFPAGKLDIHPVQGASGMRRIWLSGADSLRLHLPGGRYLMAFDGGEGPALHRLSLAFKQTAALHPGDFKRVPPGRLRAKGASLQIHANSVGFATGLARLPFGPAAPIAGLRLLHVSHPLQWFFSAATGADHFEGRIAGAPSPSYTVERRFWKFDLGASLPLRRWWRLLPLLEASGGPLVLRQVLTDHRFGDDPPPPGIPAEKSSWNLSYAVQAGPALEISLLPRLALHAAPRPSAYLYPKEGGTGWGGHWSLEPQAALQVDF